MENALLIEARDRVEESETRALQRVGSEMGRIHKERGAVLVNAVEAVCIAEIP